VYVDNKLKELMGRLMMK